VISQVEPQIAKPGGRRFRSCPLLEDPRKRGSSVLSTAIGGPDFCPTLALIRCPAHGSRPLRFVARALALERRVIRLTDVQLAAAALACLRGTRRERAEKTLFGLL
jgi:hypothetical protein